MTLKPNPSANDFDDLPEPLRSRAAALFDELCKEGEPEEAARRKARGLVEQWAKERVPVEG